MDEKLRFIARLLEGEKMAPLCREFGKNPGQISVADARGDVWKNALKAARGEDPMLKPEADIVTFNDLQNRYIARYAEPNVKPKTVAEYERILRKDLLPAWKNRNLATIKKTDVTELLSEIGIDRESPVTANRVRALLSGMFKWAIEHDVMEYSQCDHLPKDLKFQEESRDRVLSDGEIEKLWAVFDGWKTNT